MPRYPGIVLACRKADKKGLDNLRSKIIQFWTREKYSHTELYFPEGDSFSSDGFDGGVRWKTIGYSHPERWDFYSVPGYESLTQRLLLRKKCDSMLGKKYDFPGIVFWFIIPIRRQSNKKWWCSEVCAYVLGFKKFRVSPGKLARMILRKKGKKLTEREFYGE